MAGMDVYRIDLTEGNDEIPEEARERIEALPDLEVTVSLH